MKTIHVSTGKPYDVIIEAGVLERAGQEIKKAAPSDRAVIVSDSNVWPLYGEKVKASLEKEGYDVISFVFPAGEASKNITTYAELQEFMAAKRLSRSGLLVALGGGVTGDLGGFAAATYQRGIRYVQIPTSLLAMVDSSVGGKTAIDIAGGKNMVGAFCQPALVLCDPEALQTLSPDLIREGMGEVIKYGALGDRDFFLELDRMSMEQRIARCVEMKRDIVEVDEFDHGERQKLNLGHSFGHAIEALSEFKLYHGDAVATGMAMIYRAASRFGYCPQAEAEQMIRCLKAYGFATDAPFSSEEIAEAAMGDKKFSGNTIHLIVPEGIGRCQSLAVAREHLADWVRAGREA